MEAIMFKNDFPFLFTHFALLRFELQEMIMNYEKFKRMKTCIYRGGEAIASSPLGLHPMVVVI